MDSSTSDEEIELTPQELKENVKPRYSAMSPGSSSSSSKSPSPHEGSEVLITGMSGRFPACDSVKEYMDKLYGKVDMTTDCSARWNWEHPEVPSRLGLISKLDKFDAQFFGVHYKQANAMEPMLRKMLECTCEALIDAGVSPRSLKNQKVGVFIGGTLTENEKQWVYNSRKIDGYGLTGTSRAMYANRISYWLGVTAPSYTMDGGECSGAMALHHAYEAIQSGQCEAAVVGGASLCLHPFRSLNTSRMGLMSKSAVSKPFCEDADGFVRSESVTIFILQKAKDATRSYAQIVHAKTEFTSIVTDDQQSTKFPSGPEMTGFIRQFYEEANVDPKEVNFVEACGIGLPETDRQELESLESVYCGAPREHPLLVGCVKSNIGNSEVGSNLCSLAKVLLCYHTGKISPNLNLDRPVKTISSLTSGEMRLVSEESPLEGPYAALNAFSYNGINAHILLKKYPEEHMEYPVPVGVPSLVCVSGRVEESVEATLEELEQFPRDLMVPLVHAGHRQDVPGFIIRGYSILDTIEGKTVCVMKEQAYFGGDKKPIWFVYSGMGSQWTTMGGHLMKIPIFAEAIYKCHAVLEPRGVDLLEVLTSPDDSIFQNIVNSFVGIAAVQIGLTDVLRALGITPDYIIGHSVGELGCAYADGCLTAEQMILAAYYRGLVSLQSPLIHGSMAAIGMGYSTIKSLVPEDIDVACHNGPDSCTISGPSASVKEYVAHLREKGVFAKMVPTSNIAYHSRYIAPAGPPLRKYLEGVVPVVRRSSKWISTSVPRPDLPSAADCSPHYLTNNLLSPVYFEECLSEMSQTAVVVEVSPHGLLQAILRRARPDALHIPLTRRGHHDNTLMMLQAIGKLYVSGCCPRVEVLHPAPRPLPAHAPLLGHTLRWNHDETWAYYQHRNIKVVHTGERHVLLSVADQEYRYLTGYQLEGVNVLSPGAVLVLVWETLGMTLGVPYKQFSVELKNVQFLKAIKLPGSEVLELLIMLQRASGEFEVSIQGVAAVKGTILQKSDFFTKSLTEPEECDEFMTRDDIYRMLSTRGQQYSGEFRSIESINTDLSRGSLKWVGSWSCFLDGLMQVAGGAGGRPRRFVSLAVDLTTHLRISTDQTGVHTSLPFTNYPLHNVTRCLGIELIGLDTVPIVNRDDQIWKQIITHAQTQSPPTTIKPVSEDQVKELTVLTPGDHDSLNWRSVPIPLKIDSDSIPVQVHYVQLSDTDLMKLHGRQLPGCNRDKDRLFGMSYSGVAASGSRVMGVMEGCCGEAVGGDGALCWPVPPHWSLAEAATVPHAYLTAYYALLYRGNLKPGLSVLITRGHSEVGIACISVCLASQCDVFTTVTRNTQKTWLMNMFPELKERNIINTNERNVTDVILSTTGGEGVRFVVNMEHGEQRQMILNCAGLLSVFVDLSVEDVMEGERFGMTQLDLERNYVTAILAHLLHTDNNHIRRELQKLIYQDICEGLIRPIPHTVFEAGDAPRAFRLLSTRRHPGAILVKLQSKSAPLPTNLKILDEVCLVVCGRNNLGVEIVDSLLRMGVGRFLVHTSEPTSGFLLMNLRLWKEKGARVSISAEDISSRSGCRSIWTFAAKLGSVRGVFIMRDDVVRNMDQVSKKLGKNLKHFVIFTSISGSSDVTSICKERVKSGFPGKTIKCFTQLPDVGDIESQSVSLSRIADYIDILLEHNQQTVTSLVTNHNDQGIRPDLKIRDIDTAQEKVGFPMFFTPCHLPEITAAEPVMWLPTLADDADKVIQSAEGEDYLLVLPGMEGHGGGVERVCRRLKLRALLCQFITHTHPHTVPQLATLLIQRIEHQVGFTKRFYILGVSFGCLLALEMAAMLERKGLTGKVFCLDGSPSATPAIFKHHVGDHSLPDLQDLYLSHMRVVLTGKPGAIADGTWDEKVADFIKTKRNTSTIEYVKLVLKAGYIRMKSLIHYKPEDLHLKAPIVLIKPRCNVCDSYDYDLGRFTSGDVKVYEVNATHADVTEQLGINNIILDEIDDDILQKYESANHCVSYIEEE